MSDSNWRVVQLGVGGRSQRKAGKVPNTEGHKVGQSLWEEDLRTVLRAGCELGLDCLCMNNYPICCCL